MVLESLDTNLNNMPHANGTTHGVTKRDASQKILNDGVGVQKNREKHEKTDYTRWRLKDDRGCQTWHYLTSDEEIKAWPQSTADKYFLGLNTVGLRQNLPTVMWRHGC
jgi:lanosterol synthase